MKNLTVHVMGEKHSVNLMKGRSNVQQETVKDNKYTDMKTMIPHSEYPK
jgi:hypothetical protein